MSIGFGDKQSKITFGGYDKERYAIGRVNWHQIDENSNYWSLKVDDIQLEFNGQNISMGAQKAIVDSGTSYVMMPTPAYNRFMTHLMRHYGFKIFRYGSTATTECNEYTYRLFPDIRFTIDGVEYMLPRESYVTFHNGLYSVCHIKIATNPMMPFWILGLNFFQNYYTIFD